MEKKHMLLVMGGTFGCGGIETYLLNMLPYLNWEKYDVDFFIGDHIFDNERGNILKQMNLTIMEQYDPVPENDKRILVQIHFYINSWMKMKKILSQKSYDILYINAGSPLYFADILYVSRMYGVPERIAHSHNDPPEVSLIKRLVRLISRRIILCNATKLLACSKRAAVGMFGKRAAEMTSIIRNGIDLEKFRFSEKKRIMIRERLNIQEKIVLGHIGRFVEQKNHSFLIEVFHEFVQIQMNAVLLLIGEGDLETHIRELVHKHGLEEKVIFLGTTSDVDSYLCAMDVFMLPSLFEGLGIAAIEAQASGIPCLLSNRITKEVSITDKVRFIDIEKGVQPWVATLNEIEISNEIIQNRKNAWMRVRDAGYDKESAKEEFQKVFT